MFNSCGFFIEYGSDVDYRPGFFGDKVDERTRFRLMQWVLPAESWDLYNWTSGDPGFKESTWYTEHTSGDRTRNIHVLAENVIALVLTPRLSGTEDPTGTALAPDFVYNSAPAAWPPAKPQPDMENQLPPIIQATLVSLDEASAARLEGLSDDPVEFLGLNELFQAAAEFDQDMEKLKETLQDNRLQYRVFQSAIQLKSR